jgi:hypothetical protein
LEKKRGEGGGDPCLGALEYFGRHRSRQKRSGDVLVESGRNGKGTEERESHPCLVMLVLEDPAIMENVKSLF